MREPPQKSSLGFSEQAGGFPIPKRGRGKEILQGKRKALPWLSLSSKCLCCVSEQEAILG